MSKMFAVFVLATSMSASVHLAEAQQSAKVPRIGYLSAASRSALTARTEAFRQGLRDLGYVDRSHSRGDDRRDRPDRATSRAPNRASSIDPVYNEASL